MVTAQDIDNLIGAVQTLRDAVDNAISPIQNMVTNLNQVQTAQQNVQNTTKKTRSIFTKFGKALEESKGKLGVVVKLGYLFVPFGFKIKNAMELSSKAIGKFSDGINDTVDNVKNLVMSFGFIQKMSPMLKQLKEGATTKLAQSKVGKTFGFGMQGSAKDQLKQYGSILGDKFGQLKSATGIRDRTTKLFSLVATTVGIPYGKLILKPFSKVLRFTLTSIGKIMLVFSLFVLGAFLLFRIGRTIFAQKNTLEKIKSAFESLKEKLKGPVELIMKGFTTIKDAFTKGSFLEGLGTLFLGLLEIGVGLLWVLLEASLTFLRLTFAPLTPFITLLQDNIKNIIAVILIISVTMAAVFVIQKSIAIATFLMAGYQKVSNVIAGINAFWNMWTANSLLSIALTLGIILLTILGVIAIFGSFKKWLGFKAEGGRINTPLTVVGERGPEILVGKQGANVISNKDAKAISSGGITNNITVNVQGRIGASDSELRQIAQKVGQMINREINRTTSSRTGA